MQLLLRFLIGGAFVSLFSVLGGSLKPKSFAGLFSAAPSIALSGLILTYFNKGMTDVTTEAYSMIFAGVALSIYCLSSAVCVKKMKMPPWIFTCILWLEWFAISFGFYKGLLQ